MNPKLLFFSLLLAHLLGDFVWQPLKWIQAREDKRYRTPQLYLHGLVHAFLAILAISLVAQQFKVVYLLAGLVLGAVHIAIDPLKGVLEQIFDRKNLSMPLFLADQLIHLLAVGGMCLFMGEWSHVAFELEARHVMILSAYVIVIWPFSVIIGMATARWQTELEDEANHSLKDAGRWIGRMERILILTFVLLGQFGAIGFVMAAKSAFRFGDLRQSQDRQRTEYILIGTLLSFSMTLILGLVIKHMLT